MSWQPRGRELDPAKLVAVIIFFCLVYCWFQPEALVILKDIMLSAVSGFFGYLARSIRSEDDYR